ncbi:isocitrate lyase/phosphoenolpyruvate mutase family protein [Streptomyces sp. NPDC057236]|uniref:isocitrate lyase/phosphoenolpyruvate mutase family protein n=1 Tax=Streptomyces sp. NPDC057236 TaxID=3346059 RepID=UPI0036342552
MRGAGGADDTSERAAAALAAGADGIFVPGAVDPGTVKELADGIDAPPDVMAGPGAPSADEPAAPVRRPCERRLRHRPGGARLGPPRGSSSARGRTTHGPTGRPRSTP